MSLLVIVRGGGDLASGVVLRLARCGVLILVTEIAQPLAVRRSVSFAQALYQDSLTIEGIKAARFAPEDNLAEFHAQSIVPVMVDPLGDRAARYHPDVMVDARMRKRPPEWSFPESWMTIGLGPGFEGGVNCDAAIETMRGHHLGKVYWHGSPQADTGRPESVGQHDNDRVLRAPATGAFHSLAQIGDRVKQGAAIAQIGGEILTAPFDGIIRGMLMDGILATEGMKVGDVDPRAEPLFCTTVSDKALAVGGGVMEAILSRPLLRAKLCQSPPA